MLTLDRRTKRRSLVRPMTLAELVDEVAPAAHGPLADRAQRLLGLPPLVLEVDGAACTIDAGTIRPGATGGAVVAVLERGALSDLVAGLRTPTGLLFQPGEVELARGTPTDFAGWDHVLRALFDGVPLHESGDIELGVNVAQTFSPDDDDACLAEFLAAAGFLHLRGWVEPAVLGPIDAEIASASRVAERDDPHRWWARLVDGTERCVRVMRALDVSQTMASLVESRPFRRLGGLFADGHRRFPEEPQSSEAIIKPLDVSEGLSDFPWHRDCSQAGHDYRCAGYAIGLPLSATGTEAGHLEVVAGSHRVNMPAPRMLPGYEVDLPVVALHTEPGDLTVHVGCSLHRTRRPRSVERTVVYTTYGLPALD